MAFGTQLECDVHALLDEANVLVLAKDVDAESADDLMARIKRCTEQARQAGLSEIVGHLSRALQALDEKRPERRG